jgi:hypothetical protein
MASLEALLRTPTICAALKQAWQESQPGLSGGHEEGGFIVQEPTGALRVIRWPQGSGSTIIVPTHDGCQFEGADIIASFHTHPNTGPDYLQEPTESDKSAVREDPNLKSPGYAGELVISVAVIYGITPSGSVVELGETASILADA